MHYHRHRWVVCGLLFAATMANYADRQLLPLLKPSLDATLHWTNREYGAVNAAFQIAYAVGTLGFGWFIDRVGVKLGYVVSSICLATASIVHASVSSVAGFAGARFALGIGSGGNFPGAVKAVAIWFPASERALATTLFNGGGNIAAVVSPALVPLIVAGFGWRAAFIVAACVALCWLGAWLRLYREPPPPESPVTERPAAARSGEAAPSWLALLRQRETWAFVVPKCITDPVWGLLLIWLPGYFKETHHRDLAGSWMYLTTIYLIATLLSLAGGWLPEWLVSRGWTVQRARRAALIAAACAALPIVAAGYVGIWGAVVLIGVTGAAHQAWSANLFTLASDLFPARTVASIVGFGGLISALGVAGFYVLSGVVLDHFAARGAISTGYHLLFASFAFVYFAALVAHHYIAAPLALSAERR